MPSSSFVTIGRNIKSLREAIGLSQHDFAIVTDLSKRSIANIETGNINTTKVLDKILTFFKLQLIDVSRTPFFLSKNFRGSVLQHHQKLGSPAVEILSKQPTIVYAIKFVLLESQFLEEPKSIGEIRVFFESHNWRYKSSSITNALLRMPDLITADLHESKKNTNVYMKKSKSNNNLS